VENKLVSGEARQEGDKPGKARCRSLMGQSRPNQAIVLESALTSTPDISLHRTK